MKRQGTNDNMSTYIHLDITLDTVWIREPVGTQWVNTGGAEILRVKEEFNFRYNCFNCNWNNSITKLFLQLLITIIVNTKKPVKRHLCKTKPPMKYLLHLSGTVQAKSVSWRLDVWTWARPCVQNWFSSLWRSTKWHSPMPPSAWVKEMICDCQKGCKTWKQANEGTLNNKDKWHQIHKYWTFRIQRKQQTTVSAPEQSSKKRKIIITWLGLQTKERRRRSRRKHWKTKILCDRSVFYANRNWRRGSTLPN